MPSVNTGTFIMRIRIFFNNSRLIKNRFLYDCFENNGEKLSRELKACRRCKDIRIVTELLNFTLQKLHLMDNFELMAQGAEARLYKGNYLGRATLVKERFEKKYRHSDLDTRLSKDRIKAEARAIVRAKAAGVLTPALYLIDLDRRRIYMEYIENATVLKDFIDINISEKSNVGHLLDFIGCGLGTLIARLHSKNIIHGDLTTSNVLLKPVDITRTSVEEAVNHFVLIDFGLARVDSTVEDKAVDIYVLERSLLSAHSEVPSIFSLIFDTYKKYYTNKAQCNEVISKYKEVQARGRKRLMVG